MEMPRVPLVAILNLAIPATLRGLAIRVSRETTSAAVIPRASPVPVDRLRKESTCSLAESSAHGGRSVLPSPAAALGLRAGRERHCGNRHRHAPYAAGHLRHRRCEPTEDERELMKREEPPRHRGPEEARPAGWDQRNALQRIKAMGTAPITRITGNTARATWNGRKIPSSPFSSPYFRCQEESGHTPPDAMKTTVSPTRATAAPHTVELICVTVNTT